MAATKFDALLNAVSALVEKLPLDKRLHFLVGHAVTFAVVFVMLAATGSALQAGTVAAVVLTLMAVGKELYDSMHRDMHTPDVLDAVATMLGGVPVLTLVYILETIK